MYDPDATVALILAGGRGRRLWPFSTLERPKPFRALFGAEPPAARVVRQAAAWLGSPSSVWLSLGEAQLAAARDAVPGLERHTIVLEQRPAETTAAIARAAMAIAARRPSTVLVVLAADQRLEPDDELLRALDCAASVARSGPWLVSLGVPPDGPSTRYGYMRLGAPISMGATPPSPRSGLLTMGATPPSPRSGLLDGGAWEGLGYIEKPGPEAAARLLAEGRCLWNAGIFAFRVDTLLAALERHVPGAVAALAAGGEPALRAIDYELMERVRPGDPERHAFVEARCAFHDCGSLAALAEEVAPDARGNRIRGDASAVESDGCTLLCEAPRRLRVSGLSGILVAASAEGNVLVAGAGAELPLAVGLVTRGRGCSIEHGPPLVKTIRVRGCRFGGDPGVEVWARDVEDLSVHVGAEEVTVTRISGARRDPEARTLDLQPCADEDEVGAQAADLVVEILRAVLARRGRAVVVPSTGRTMLRCYALLAARHRRSLDWQRVEVFQMDEVEGVPEALTARSFLMEHLIEPLGIGRTCIMHDVTLAEGVRVERELAAAGPDLVIHGLGENGHIGLNEPGSAFDCAAREVTLDEDTRQSKQGHFGAGEPPRRGLTLGLGALLGAPRSLLLAIGAHKRQALSRALFSPVSNTLPASGLQLQSRVTVIADREALPLDRLVAMAVESSR